MIGSMTLSLYTAGGCLTHRDADTVQAVTSLVISTIIIVNAANSDAGQGWITLHAWGTVALSPVQDGSALGIETAGRTSIGAWVHTVLIDTCPIHWTVVVNHTFRCEKCRLFLGLTCHTAVRLGKSSRRVRYLQKQVSTGWQAC